MRTATAGGATSANTRRRRGGTGAGPGSLAAMSDRSRKIAKPAAAFGVLATMASIWWFALRPRRKVKLDK